MRTIGKKELLLVPGYALLYVATRECSVVQEHLSVVAGQLPSGLRFAALLFLPPRLWPYILAGDFLGSLYYRVGMLPTYGWAWLLAALVLPPLSALVTAGSLQMSGWLSGDWTLSSVALKMVRAAGAASVLNALSGVLALCLENHPGKGLPLPGSPLMWASAFTLSIYLGMLMTVPLMLSLAILKRLRNRGITSEMQFDGSRVFLLALKTGALLTAFGSIQWLFGTREVDTISDLLMFGPAVWMTVRYGWTGSVVSTVLANTALQVVAEKPADIDLLEMQVLMALVSTGLLILGASLTEHRYRSRVSARESGHHLELARKNLSWGEARVRRTAHQVERAFIALQAQAEETANVLQLEHGPAAGAMLRWHGHGIARSGVRNVIAGMHLDTLETRGLKTALLYGLISDELREANISYSARTPREMTDLPSDMALMLFRLAHDLVMMLTRDNRAYRVSLRLRYVPGARRSVALVVKVWPGGGDMPPLPAPCSEMEDIRAIAQTFKGLVHDRRRARRPTVGLILRDF